MKTMLRLFGLSLVLMIAYLAFWPVAITPQKWAPLVDQGFTGEYAANSRLANLDRLSIGDYHGPEDVVIVREGGREIIYTTSQDGVIIRVDTEANSSAVFAKTGGRPLGMERDLNGNFIVADAFRGLLSITPDGKQVTVLTDSFEGQAIAYADDLDIAENGVIYFSDASTKFGAQEAGSTLAASLLEISEHAKTGRILSFNPASAKTELVAGNYSFANGVAMCPDSMCILVNETGEYSIDRIYVDGPRKGEVETLLENLPGFPDNINRGSVVDGKQTYWVGLASPRSKPLDDTAQIPFLRSLSLRLPEALQISPTAYGFVMQINEDGQILQTLQDPDGAYALTTGAIEGQDWLYITSLGSHDLGRVRYP
ncbi:MAG: sugar lactone lactonase YvrE [Halieaceae bacterium]|jgi:sugar lactone lactonase YvrE